MHKYVIVAPDGTQYFPFEGCRLLELPEYQDEYFDQTISWFNRFLKQGEPLPNMKLHGK